MKNKISFTLKAMLLVLLLSLSRAGIAQTFTESYSSNAGWTMNGGSYTIGPANFSFNNTPGAAFNYATKQVLMMSNTAWCAEIDFNYTARTNFGAGHTLLSFTQNTSNSWNAGTVLLPSNNNAIEAYILTNPTGVGSPTMIYGRSKLGTVWNTPSLGIVLPPPPTQYHIRLQRLSATQGMITVYIGSTILGQECFPINAAVIGLTYLQHGVIPQGGVLRGMNGTLDNLSVIPNVTGITGLPSHGGICPGTISTLCANLPCGANGQTWAVPPGSVIQSGQGTNCISVLWGTTSGTVTSTFSFPNTSCVFVQSAPVTLYPAVVANAGPDIILCCGTIYYLGSTSGSASGGTAPYTYSWSPGTNLSCTTCPSPQLAVCTAWTINQPYNFTLTVTDANGCTAQDVVTVTRIPCRLANPDGSTDSEVDGIVVSPNPSEGLFTIKFKSNEGNRSVVITNLLGEVVFKSDANNVENILIDLSGKPKGMYIVKCEENGQSYTQEIIIQ